MAKIKLDAPDVETSMRMIEQGQSPVTAAKAGGYKTVAGMRSAIRAYRRAKSAPDNGENAPENGSEILSNPFSPRQEKPVSEAVKPSERTETKRYTDPIPYTVTPPKKSDPEAEAEAVTAAENKGTEKFDLGAPFISPISKKTEQEIIEADEPLRTLETSNFRISYRARSKTLRLTIRRVKDTRYLQIKSSEARELYAALGYMLDRYNLDKDDECEQEE